MKKEFIFILLLTIITLNTAAPDAFIVTAPIADENVHANQNDSICETPVCVHAASFALHLADPSIDPCENFYQFACGRFMENTIIPDDQYQTSMFATLNDKIDQQLRLSISTEIKEDDQSAIKLMKSYYQICMDTDQIENNSKTELQKVLKDMGGCPVLEGAAWDETNFDWKRSVYKVNKIGYETNIFIKMGIGTDPQNSTKHIIHIKQPSTELPREFLINDTNKELVKTYLSAVRDLFHLLGADKHQAEKEVNATVNFEIELAKIMVPKEERRDGFKNEHRLTLDQLEANYSSIPWSEYLNEILAPHAHIDRNEEVNLIDSNFFENFPRLLEKTPKRVLANYLCVNILSQSIDYMGQGFLAIQTKATQAFTGVVKQKPRWKKCLEHVYSNFAVGFSGLYVKNYFDKDSKTNVIHLTKKLRSSLLNLIEQTDWMDNATKIAALEKLQSVVARVGYPEELNDDEKINKLYENITLDYKSFRRSYINLLNFEKKAAYSKLNKTVNALKWTNHAGVAEANAFYYLDENSFDLPAGILQGYFYHKDRPNYMNFGTIGWTIGHELSHAFDDEGSQYDKNGNLFNWWKNETKEEYFRRAKCIIDQYGNYTVKEVNMKINGINTQGENIADNVGLKAAYFAYNDWAKDNSKEPQLPGLHYTPHQMFWISAAQSYCTKVRPKQLKYKVAVDTHAYAEFRVIGSMSNLPEFSKDFNCPLGSPMNPVKKCSVW